MSDQDLISVGVVKLGDRVLIRSMCKKGLRKLETLNVLTFMRKHAAYVKLLFAANTSVLTAQAMLALFEVNWSLPGCPQREREEAVLVAWSEYVMNIEGA